MIKQFWAFVKKEIKHISRDYRTLLILIGMPVAQVILFGFAIKNEITEAGIAIIDKSHDEMTAEIKTKILATDYFILNDELNSESLLEDVFKKGKTKIAIVFEPNFEHNFHKNRKANLQIIADASDPNMATQLINYTSSIIRDYQFEKNKFKKIPYFIQPEIKMLYNPTLKSSIYFVPGVMSIILMLVSTMMTSITITREKEMGTMEVLLVSPLKPAMIVVGKVIPYVVLSLFNALTILFLGVYVFGVPINGNLLLLFVEILLFVLTTLSLGILISTISKTQQVAMMISLMGLMLPTILLSGFVFPIENMPFPLQMLSHIVPAKWFIIIVKGIMIKGIGFSYIIKETTILGAMSIVFTLLSIRNFSIRLE